MSISDSIFSAFCFDNCNVYTSVHNIKRKNIITRYFCSTIFGNNDSADSEARDRPGLRVDVVLHQLLEAGLPTPGTGGQLLVFSIVNGVRCLKR